MSFFGKIMVDLRVIKVLVDNYNIVKAILVSLMLLAYELGKRGFLDAQYRFLERRRLLIIAAGVLSVVMALLYLGNAAVSLREYLFPCWERTYCAWRDKDNPSCKICRDVYKSNCEDLYPFYEGPDILQINYAHNRCAKTIARPPWVWSSWHDYGVVNLVAHAIVLLLAAVIILVSVFIIQVIGTVIWICVTSMANVMGLGRLLLDYQDVKLKPALPHAVSIDSPSIMVAQFSDLHITRPNTVPVELAHSPGNFDTYHRLELAFADLALNCPIPSALVISGDLTDTGDKEEWERLEGMLKKTVGKAFPIYMAPGNHDIALNGIGKIDCDSAHRKDRERRFVEKMIRCSPDTLRAYDGTPVLKCGTLDIDRIFPVHDLIKNDQNLNVAIVILDSNRRLSRHIITNAIGALGKIQLARLLEIIQYYRDMHVDTIIVVLHHHVARIPVEDSSWSPMKWLSYKFMRIEDHAMALPLLTKGTVILHGHRHIPYLGQHPVFGTHVLGCGSTTLGTDCDHTTGLYLLHRVWKGAVSTTLGRVIDFNHMFKKLISSLEDLEHHDELRYILKRLEYIRNGASVDVDQILYDVHKMTPKKHRKRMWYGARVDHVDHKLDRDKWIGELDKLIDVIVERKKS